MPTGSRPSPLALRRARAIYTLASGANYGAAYSYAICVLMEMQWYDSQAIHANEFFHGPFEVVDRDAGFVVMLGLDETRRLTERARDFLFRFGSRDNILVLDAAELDLTGMVDRMKPYLVPLILFDTLWRFAYKLADLRRPANAGRPTLHEEADRLLSANSTATSSPCRQTLPAKRESPMTASSKPRHVVVVGAGIFGVSSALHLARLGVDVTIVTDGAPAGGASGRSLSWLNSARRSGHALLSPADGRHRPLSHAGCHAAGDGGMAALRRRPHLGRGRRGEPDRLGLADRAGHRLRRASA